MHVKPIPINSFITVFLCRFVCLISGIMVIVSAWLRAYYSIITNIVQAAFFLPAPTIKSLGVIIMPYKPRHPCAHPGCLALVSGRFCEAHAQADARAYARYRRDPETDKRYGRAWRRIRAAYIAAHPLCEECQKSHEPL